MDFLGGDRTAVNPNKGTVVVIGAGPAGLTAASHLQVSLSAHYCHAFCPTRSPPFMPTQKA